MESSSHPEHTHQDSDRNKSDVEYQNPYEKIPGHVKKEIHRYYQDVVLESIPSSERERKIAFKFIPRYENNVLALVYIGAAFLVVVLGLRGLGSSIPDFMQDPLTHRLQNWVVFTALFTEFLMILFLGLTMLFKVEDFGGLFKHFINVEQKHKGGIQDLETIEEIGKAIDKLNHDYDDLKNKLNKLR